MLMAGADSVGEPSKEELGSNSTTNGR
jgi:hypothetical protein